MEWLIINIILFDIYIILLVYYNCNYKLLYKNTKILYVYIYKYEYI